MVFVHGGAGKIPHSRDLGKHNGTKVAARLGYDKLMATGSVIDAVEEAVRSMELDENFNCGKKFFLKCLDFKLTRNNSKKIVNLNQYNYFQDLDQF